MLDDGVGAIPRSHDAAIQGACMTWSMGTAARTLAQEARGEPIEGQTAVAHVLKNRLASGRWGESLASVCLWHAQFSGWWCPRGVPVYYDPNFAYACNLDDNDSTLSHMMSVMQAAMDSTTDPTGGALFYHASNMAVPPLWASKMRFCGQFGHQTFYSDQPAPAVTGV